jgi:hypothetical protein
MILRFKEKVMTFLAEIVLEGTLTANEVYKFVIGNQEN